MDCASCEKRVYPVEAVTIDGISYHKECMKCAHCDGKVGLKGLAMIGDKIYCKPHFKELFKLNGGSYDNFGSTSTVTASASAGSSSFDKSSPTKRATWAPGNAMVKEDLMDESDLARTLNAIKSSPHKTPPLVSLQVPEHKEPEYAKTLAAIKNKNGATSNQPSANVGSAVYKAVRMRNLTKLKKVIQQEGVEVLFEKGSDGVTTPIEFAFRSNNQECARYMMDQLEDFVWIQLGKKKKIELPPTKTKEEEEDILLPSTAETTTSEDVDEGAVVVVGEEEDGGDKPEKKD